MTTLPRLPIRATCLLLLISASAQAAITLTDATNVTLAASQTEFEGNTSVDPDVTEGAGGALVPYTETGSFPLGSPYLGGNLDDGDVGSFIPSDGTYAVSDSGTLVLDFGGAQTIGSIAIYNGYTDRDDGAYTLRDAASNLLGAWTIATAPGGANDGADSFWLTFDTPVTTTSLTIEATSSEVSSTVSYREVQVMATTPVPGPGVLFNVDSTADALDAVPGDGICATGGATCTLRAAIEEANALPGPDQIALPAGTYALTLDGSPESNNASGDLNILDDVQLTGAGSSCTTGSIITIGGTVEEGLLTNDAVSTLSGLCFTGAMNPFGSVTGALENTEHLSLEDVRIDTNEGVGFYNSGIAHYRGGAVVDSSRCCDPLYTYWGYGIENQGILNLSELEIGSNDDRGIKNSGVLTVINSYIHSTDGLPSAEIDSGYAVSSNILVTMTNVSIEGNGGIISNYGQALLTNVTTRLNSNIAIGPALTNSGGTLELRNSIVMDDCNGTTSLGHNVESGTSCGFTATGDLQNTAIALAQDSSGSTTTLVPTSNTNIQDLGDAVGCPHLDQRHHFRPEGGGCDIGAAELGSALACANGLDDDGDGLCDAIGGACTDGSDPGDPGCANASDPQELDLAAADILTGDSDASVKRLDPVSGDVQILSRGLGLWEPYGVTADENHVYVSDAGRILEIDRETGVPWVIAVGISNPGARGLSIDASGKLLTGDPENNRIYRIDPATGYVAWLPNTDFAGPEYVSEDPSDGTLLVSDYISSTPEGIYRIDANTGYVFESWTGAPFGSPRQHVLSEDGATLWVVDSGWNRLWKLDLTAPMSGSNPVQIGGGIQDAWGLAIDADGDLIVATRFLGHFLRVDPDTGVTTSINTADVARPHEIAIVPLPEPARFLMLSSGVFFLVLLGRLRHR